MPSARRRSGWPRPDSSSNCGEFTDPGAHHDLARGTRFMGDAGDRVADADAPLAVEQQRLGQGIGHDAEIAAAADRIEVAARRAHPPTRGDRRLAHGDAVLLRTVVVGIVPDADLTRGLDQCREQRIAPVGIGDAQRTVAAAEGIVALAFVSLHLLEEGQHVAVAPAAVAHLRPRVEVLRLAAHEGLAVDGARTAQQAAARHRQAAAVGRGLRFGAVQPVGRRIGDQLRVADRDVRPRIAGRSRLQQQHAVARVGRQPVGHHGAGRAGADDDVIVGLHVGAFHLKR